MLKPVTRPAARSTSPSSAPNSPRPKPQAEQAADSKPTSPARLIAALRPLWEIARPYRRTFWLGLTAALLSSGLNLVFPALFGRLVDASFLQMGTTDTGTLDRTVLLLIAVFAVSAVLAGVQSYLLAKVGAGVVMQLRRQLFGHLLTLSPSFFGAHRTGDLTSRLTADVGTVQNVSSAALASLAMQGLTLMGGVALLVATNPRLSFYALIGMPLIIAIAVVIGRQIRRVSREVQDEIAAANASAEEAIAGIRVVQSFTAEDVERGRYGAGVWASFTASLRRARWYALMGGTMSFLPLASLALVLWFGGRQVMSGELTPGALVTFLFYAMQVGGAIAGLTGLFNQFQEAAGASSRIFELLDERPELSSPPDALPLTEVRGEVQFENVSFGYGDRLVLDGINLEARRGQTVALVGPSGAGKSTLVSLLPRFFDVTGGQILLDGVDIRRLDLTDLRRHIGLVPQFTELFSGTVAENIRYGRPDATDAEVQAAARAANADGFVRELPDGYNTLIGERGLRLSGGQRQRIAIARATLKNPAILVLDEATSALDNHSEALVQTALAGLMQGRTTFVIAHRLSTIEHAGLIAVMDGGRIVERGTHAELLAAGGLYASLHQRWADGEIEGVKNTGDADSLENQSGYQVKKQ